MRLPPNLPAPPPTLPPKHDGAFDFSWAHGAEQGWYMKPAAATEEEKQEAYTASIRRELTGIKHRLEHVDDPALFGKETPERRQQIRAELEQELSNANRELERATLRLAEVRGETGETTLGRHRLAETTVGRRGRGRRA